MSRKINPLNTLVPGQEVNLLCHGSKTYGNDPYELDTVFLRYEGEGAARHAVFTDLTIYKYVNRWCYGISAERISLIE